MLIDVLKKENLLALKEKNQNKRAILGIVINKLMLTSIELKAQNKTISPEQEIQIVLKTLKELDEELEGYKTLNKEDKIKEINEQKEILNSFLPKMLSEQEIVDIINSLPDKSIPNVMKHFKTNYAGKVDMSKVSGILKNIQ